jgi:2-polyprenyl-6-methoxyphenol hydroxylase-like FAD-dependent oxidoreductase
MKVIIAGAGIGGLTAALSLVAKGVEVVVCERAPEILPLGVGLTLLPHAIAVADRLGLVDEIADVATEIEHMHFRTRRGESVWHEPRGTAAGHKVPQFTIHRAALHKVLLDALASRAPGSLKLGTRFVSFRECPERVVATFQREDGSSFEIEGDGLVGADGLRSELRRRLFPEEGPPVWSGRMLWRGSVDWPSFMNGEAVVVSGGTNAKLVVYPIGPGQFPGHQLTNWALIWRMGNPGDPIPASEVWNGEAQLEEIAELIPQFTLPEVDVAALIAATPVFWRFPMCDRDPLPNWGRGRVTLLGDAAHPMFPFGANGAAQAMIDGAVLADALSADPSVPMAFASYEKSRRPVANRVVEMNREGGPERIIDLAEKRGEAGDLSQVFPMEERRAILDEYARVAGFAKP